MNWDDLRHVLACVRHGGLSGAARELGVNHATVARRIAAAEASLGARLFDRLPTGYRPTEAGRQAADAAAGMESAAVALDRAVTARDVRLSGPLKITAPQLLIEHVVAPILRDFRHLHPGIELTVVATNETLSLARREADVALRVSNTPTETLHGRRIATQRAGYYASRDYLARMRKAPDMPLDWLAFAHWPEAQADIAEVWPNHRLAMVLDDMVAMLGIVRAGLGATRMPCFLGDADPCLARLPGTPTLPYLPIWLLTHPDLRAMPRIRAFMAFVAERMATMRPLLDGTAGNSAELT